jgi:class 3 adenylate cyclase
MSDDRRPTTSRTERRLAAILAADIAGYSALMGADEDATVRDLKGHQAVILPLIAANGGRVIDTAGDGVLAEFSSILNAVTCAIVMQDVMAERNADIETDRRMQFRIGVNQGDVISDGVKLFGDGVNIAARLETIAPPGGLCISGKVYDEVRDKIGVDFEDAGLQTLKNIAQPVRSYRWVPSAEAAGDNISGSPKGRRAASRRLQTYVAAHGIEREQLAGMTGLATSDIDAALAGSASGDICARLEAALVRVDRHDPQRPVTAPAPLATQRVRAAQALPTSGTAPIEIGGYTQAATDHFVGQYLTIRPSFAGNGTIYCYRTVIFWSDDENCLVFQEENRPEAQYQHTGRVYIPPSSMFVHLVSLTKGAMRSVLLSQLQQTNEMRGLITTLANDTGAMFVPASAPIVYMRHDSLEGQQFGHLTPDDAGYEKFRIVLRDTMQKSFVRLVGMT